MAITLTGGPQIRAEFEQIRQLPPVQQCQKLFDWVASKDEERRRVALEVLKQVGRPAVAEILKQALARRCRTDKRLRLLDALGELGQPLDVLQWMMLAGTARVLGPEVGRKIWQVLLRLGHAVDEPAAAPRTIVPLGRGIVTCRTRPVVACGQPAGS